MTDNLSVLLFLGFFIVLVAVLYGICASVFVRMAYVFVLVKTGDAPLLVTISISFSFVFLYDIILLIQSETYSDHT